LIVASLTMVVLGAAPAQADTDPPNPGKVETISASPYQLQFIPTPSAVLNEIDALSAPDAGHSLDKVSVHEVAQHLNRTLYWKTTSQCDDAYDAIDDLDASINMGGWCWQPNDQANPASASDSLSAPGYW